MKNSGHSYSFRKTILHRIVARYLSSLSNHLEGRVLMYRNRGEREEMKNQNKLRDRNDTWFRSGGYTSTLCVPPTPGGNLARRVESNLKRGRQPNGTKTKVVEGNGLSSSMGLVRSNQFPQEQCERKDCGLCVHRGGGATNVTESLCRRSNIGYEGDCVRCEGTVHKYVGETSKTGYTRIKEHLASYRSAYAAKLPPLPTRHGPDEPTKDVKSWMWEHTRDVHGGQMGDQEGILDYRFKVSGTFNKCLQRQLDEGMRMRVQEADGCVLLNSKNEWFTPKLVVPNFKQH